PTVEASFPPVTHTPTHPHTDTPTHPHSPLRRAAVGFEGVDGDDDDRHEPEGVEPEGRELAIRLGLQKRETDRVEGGGLQAKRTHTARGTQAVLCSPPRLFSPRSLRSPR